MSTFRRRRGHVYSAFNSAAGGNFADDALTFAMYHDDALTMRFVTADA